MSGAAGGGKNMNVTVSLVIDIPVTILMERFSNCVIQSILHMVRSPFKYVC